MKGYGVVAFGALDLSGLRPSSDLSCPTIFNAPYSIHGLEGILGGPYHNSKGVPHG